MANLTFCRQDVEHSPFAVGITRRNATLWNASQSIFLRKEIALLRKVVGESACYTNIYVFDTKRRTIKVRKALNNKFVCVFITCEVYRNWLLIKFTTRIIVRQENRSSPEGLRKPFGKIDSIHLNDSIVATRARAVGTKKSIQEVLRWLIILSLFLFCSLLQQNEVDLQWQCSSDEKNMEASKRKHEAVQFNRHLKANSIEKWTVRSLPNLHIYFSSL